MAATIDGTTGLTSPAGGVVNPSTTVDGINYSCRAWVNFNGTGTVAIRGSGNVSSITDNGTGDYTINFTNAMPDANYNVVASANRATTVDTYLSGMVPNPTGQSTSSCRVGGRDYNSTQDCVYCNITVFR